MGVVIGFVAAYPVFEVMSGRQLPLHVAGQSTPQVPGGSSPSVPLPGAGAPAAGGPAMEQIQQLRQRVDANPNDADAIQSLAQLNLQINDLLRARALYERYVALRPEDANGILMLANLFFDTREFGRARDLYQQLLEKDPNRPEVLTDLGSCYRSLGDPQRALELFRKALEVRPEFSQALFNEVVVLGVDLKDYAAAKTKLEALRRVQPGNPNVEALATEIEKLRAL